ncbi:MAG: VWA domain-containing protein [Aeromonas sp.]
MTLHFIRPEWLFALLPLALVLWLLRRQHPGYSAWDRYIAPHLAKVLVSPSQTQSRRPLTLLALSWLIATLALAGPALNKQSLPVFASEQGRVLVMDMSISMFATDIAPNRLTQAKFRATDLLRSLKEGETGLIAFAGEAFTISPLTRDNATLLNLLPTLTPEIMPVLGSNLASALLQAKQLLLQGGHLRGDIILMTDGMSPQQFDAAHGVLKGTDYRLAIIGFGTAQGAPIRLPDGQLQRDSSNEIVVATTDFQLLHQLASNHKGIVLPYNAAGADQNQLQQWLSSAGDAKATELEGETWQDLGPYLALLLLLPVLLSFRQGMLASLSPVLSPMLGPITAMVVCGLMFAPKDAHASLWQDLWQTQDQQAMKAYQSQDYQRAAEQFTNPQWRGSAQYKAGEYEQALNTFSQDSSAQGLYNQGNALMQLGKPDKAKERYQAALAEQADFPAAKANLALAEQLLAQQQQASGQQGNGQDNSGNNGQNNSGDNGQDNAGDNGADQQSAGEQSPEEQRSGQAQGDQHQTTQAQTEPQDNSRTSAAPNTHSANTHDPKAQSEKDSAEPHTPTAEQSSAQDANDASQQASATEPQTPPTTSDDQAANHEPNDEPNKSAQDALADAQDAPDNEAKMLADSAQQANSAASAPNAKDSPAPSTQANTPVGDTIAPLTPAREPLPAQMQRALRAVSEDPQVLLRNKMQLEYQKRRANGQISRDNEQW